MAAGPSPPMTELFPYQKIGAEWLATKKVALLADEMGLGKSAQAIRAADLIQAKRILVLCPAVARVNWAREFEKFSHTPRPLHVALDGGAIPPHSSVITSYDLAFRLHERGVWEKTFFDALILDEAHFLKSLDAKRTKAVFGAKGLCHQANRTWALTGTPMPSHPGELWTMLFTFGRTRLPYPAFVERYCNFVEGKGPLSGTRQITGANRSRIPELKELLAPIMLRRKKEDVLKELPPIMFTDVIVEPGPVDVLQCFPEWVLPDDRTKELEAKISEEKRIFVEAIDQVGGPGTAAGIKLMEAMAQSIATLRRYTGIQKIASVASMVRSELENDAYHKVVIFAVHQNVIEGLRAKLNMFRAVTVYGKTEPAKRQYNVDKFQEDPKCRVFIGNIQAAGTSITLTAAHHVVFAEQSWVPGENAQAVMRVHRIGQTLPVSVRFCGLANSIDERVAEVLKRKTRDVLAIFDVNDKSSVPEEKRTDAAHLVKSYFTDEKPLDPAS
jgi:SWI/SNF-related matrix-associated actin-dependent regulator of chromatin subfamily A-like protein 1